MKHQKKGEYKMNHIDIIKYEDGIEQLVKYAVCKKLIPVFGAGFTAGCQSVNGIVPNGQRATEGMRNLILNSASCTLQKDDVEEMDFSEISDLFLNVYHVMNVQHILRIFIQELLCSNTK